MAIYVPGLRGKDGRPLKGGGRSVVALLSLTAMVDMFSVLAIFLLQNSATGEIELADEVPLPKAAEVKELKPALVVVISAGAVTVDRVQAATYDDVQATPEIEVVRPLYDRLQDAFRLIDEKERVRGLSRIKQAVDEARGQDATEKPEERRRVTVQADKAVSSGLVKKVMYTLTEAGASEINFAVLRDDKKSREGL